MAISRYCCINWFFSGCELLLLLSPKWPIYLCIISLLFVDVRKSPWFGIRGSLVKYYYCLYACHRAQIAVVLKVLLSEVHCLKL